MEIGFGGVSMYMGWGFKIDGIVWKWLIKVGVGEEMLKALK